MIAEEDALYWWEHFGFDIDMSKPTKKKRKDKTNSILSFLKNNVGNEVTVKQLVEECSISSPTAYKFINENIGWFKKARRGVYEVVDADEERRKAKTK